ncbi:MAG: spondin domain-containing protein [Bacteroidota bacterium]
MKKLLLILFGMSLSSGISFGQSQATYSVTFTSNWTQTAHPHSSGSLPGNAHWSKLVGATHNSDVVFFEMGGMATQGIEDVAEQGNNTVFFSEVNAAIAANNANNLLDGPSLSTAEGQMIINDIVTTENYPLLSVISMIAPSPDWVIAANSVALLDTNGDWIDEITIDLYPYDAGTDSGVDYTSANMDTNPQEPISSLQGVTPFSNEIIGTLQITLEGVILGVDDLSKNEVALFPNPAKGSVTISNTAPLQSVRIYNALGSEVLSLTNMNTTSKEIDLNGLSSGVYLVKATDDSNNETVKRLVKL